MKRLNLKLIYVSGATWAMFFHGVSHAGDSSAEFVMPVSIQSTFEAPYEPGKWGKSTWRSGSTFNLNNGSMIVRSSDNIVEAKTYAHTEPQRKSVNPWRIEHFGAARQYKYGPSLRPWGSVPGVFQQKSFSRQVHRVPVFNQNFLPPIPLFNPTVNKGFSGASNLLLPGSGFWPFNAPVMYRNNASFTPPYGFSNAYFRR